jgi:hypothetical protein
MAKKHWATFSVADHLDLRALVSDILLFDRLAFPYPADETEWKVWEDNHWDPKLLDYCLAKLGDLAIPFEWGKEQHELFHSNMEQAQLLDRLTLASAAFSHDEQKRWEMAKNMTRAMIAQAVQEERGLDFVVTPCYRSQDAFLTDQNLKITAPEQTSRREALAILVGQELIVPDHADLKVALDLAVDLARDEAYQRSRRSLYNWQDEVVRRDQSSQDDAQELADLVSDLNSHMKRGAERAHKRWFVFVLKRLAALPEIATSPITAIGNAFIETVELRTESKNEVPAGAIAAFHHARSRVIDPSMHSNPGWLRRKLARLGHRRERRS